MYTKNYDSTNRMQFAYFNGTPAKYAIRVYLNNAWSEWYDFARIDNDPVYKVLNLTSQFNPLGASYSLKMYGFVYIHLGFTTTRQPSEGDDIVQIIDTGDIAPVSTVAFTSRQGGYATFKIDSGSKNLRIGGMPPEADHTFVIDAIFKLN